MYMNPLPDEPEITTATWVQVFSGIAVLELICCSPKFPLCVMANLGRNDDPSDTVKKKFTVGEFPKSKIRAHGRELPRQ